MQFPMTPDESDEFYQFLHMHAVGYRFDGGYKLMQLTNPELGNNHLWYVEDSIEYRLTGEGMWCGKPREESGMIDWLVDTSHEFKTAYELLAKCGGHSLPALRRHRPDPVRVP